MQELDDMELVKQAQSGSVEAVGDLYDRHRQRIFRYIRANTGNTYVAQDLTGEVFYAMVNALPSFEPRGVPFSAWLYRIAKNLIIKERQRESKQTMVPLADAELVSQNVGNPVSVVEQQLQMEQILQGLAGLDEAQREVVVLRFMVGLSLKETAEMLDRTVGAVKTLQRRGVMALQVALDQGVQSR